MKGNLKYVTEIPMRHCKRCGTFSGNKKLKDEVPEGAELSRIILTIKEDFEVTKSFFAYTPLAFFAEIGGYLGLFIGYSLVSLADLGSLLIRGCKRFWSKRNEVGNSAKLFSVVENSKQNSN